MGSGGPHFEKKNYNRQVPILEEVVRFNRKYRYKQSDRLVVPGMGMGMGTRWNVECVHSRWDGKRVGREGGCDKSQATMGNMV